MDAIISARSRARFSAAVRLKLQRARISSNWSSSTAEVSPLNSRFDSTAIPMTTTTTEKMSTRGADLWNFIEALPLLFSVWPGSGL